MSRLDSIVFDLDGTLVDSSRQIFTAVNSARASRNQPLVSFQFVSENIGLPATFLFSDLAVTPSALQELIIKFRSDLSILIHTHNLLFPGVIQLLEFLKGDGVKIGIATSKPQNLANAVMENSELRFYVDHVQGTDGFPAKPNPQVIIKCLQSLGSNRGVMVGDRVEDVQAGNSARLFTIGLTQGPHSREQFMSAGADLVLPNVEAIFGELEKVEKGSNGKVF